MDLSFPTTAADLGQLLSASLIGDGAARIHSLSSLEDVEAGGLAFLANHKKGAPLPRPRGGVVITLAELVDESAPVTFLVVRDPQKAFAQIARKVVLERYGKEGVRHPSAQIAVDAELHPSVSVGANVIIESGVCIGKGSRVFPFAYLGRGVKIGDDSEIHVHVTLLEGTVIRNRVRVLSGSVIGSDGFGLIPGENGVMGEMPQIGGVLIDDDVRVGAKSTIDRGTFRQTYIGAGTKLDDQVHIAHNVRTGRNCIFCAQVGIAGSTCIGEGVILGGQVGVADHHTIGDFAKVGAKSGVASNLEGGKAYFGIPASPRRQALLGIALSQNLPAILKRIEKLEANDRDKQGGEKA